MNCTLCKRPSPQDPDEMIDAGWIPYYYEQQREMPGPVCPECRQQHLRFAKDGEWESARPPADAHRWN